MAIDPNNITTVDISQLPDGVLHLNDLISRGEENTGRLTKVTIQQLVDFITPYIGATGGVGFRAVTVNDGETLPATTQEEFILVGKGTFYNVGGGATIVTTEELNALVSNGTYWFLGVAIDISVDLGNFITQFIRTGFTNTAPSEDAVFNALAEKLDISDFNDFVANLPTEQRITVNDANYTITGSGSKLIAITAITADRTITLPPAVSANQRLWITDESGLCSNVRRIIVMPDGSDHIGGDSFAVINFPNGSGYLESNGLGQWNVISTTSVQFSAGVNTAPSITDNGNGSITVGTGVYALFANTNGTGRPKAYQVAGGTFTLTNQSTNFIYAEYNTTTGIVTLQQTTTETTLNDLTQILVYAAYRDGTTLHTRNFDTWGIALANKLNRSIYRTQRVRIEEGGVLLSESASPAARTITISGGTIWVGANEQAVSALTSAANTCYHVIQTSPGVWTNSTIITQYNNTQYNTTAGLQTLNNNEYGVNWVYRSIGTDNEMAIVLGSASYTLGAAQTSAKPTNLPQFLRHMELIGRIIVQKNAATATQIDNVSTTSFSSAGVTDHNALLNLQTAQSGVTYGHITDAAQTIAGVKTFSDQSIGMRNVANTFTSTFTNTNTAARTYTWPDFSGQVVLTPFTVTALTSPALNITNSFAGATSYGLQINNSNTGYGLHIPNSSTGRGININNTSTGIGAYITNSTTGFGSQYDNTGNGRGINITNSSTGQGIYTTNNGGGNGFYTANTNNGTAIYIDTSSGAGSGVFVSNTSSGKAISITNSGGGRGAEITNSNTAQGLYVINSSSGRGAYFSNSSSGMSLVLENTTPATGKPFQYLKNSIEKAFIDDTGNVSAQALISNTTVRLKGYTVATLPAGTIGDQAYVTDATAPTYLTAVVGGGAVVTPVFYNGTTWVAH